MLHPFDMPNHHRGLANLQFVPFAAHGFDQDGQMQNAATIDQIGVRGIRILHPQGQVLLGLFVEAISQVPGGHHFAFLPEERGIVDGEHHTQRWLVHFDQG